MGEYASFPDLMGTVDARAFLTGFLLSTLILIYVGEVGVAEALGFGLVVGCKPLVPFRDNS